MYEYVQDTLKNINTIKLAQYPMPLLAALWKKRQADLWSTYRVVEYPGLHIYTHTLVFADSRERK